MKHLIQTCFAVLFIYFLGLQLVFWNEINFIGLNLSLLIYLLELIAGFVPIIHILLLIYLLIITLKNRKMKQVKQLAIGLVLCCFYVPIQLYIDQEAIDLYAIEQAKIKDHDH